MIRYDRRRQALAVLLSGLAGYVDAVGFLKLGGFYVSFMSGNSTQLGVGMARLSDFALPAGLIAGFVGGVMLGTLVAHRVKADRGAAVLVLVCLLLAAAAWWGAHPLPAAILMTLAMGAENAIFEREGEVSIGVTYMTGTLVKFGQRLTQTLLGVGGDPWAWLSYLLLWAGLVVGAAFGTMAYPRLGLDALWIAAAAAALLALATARLDRMRR